MQEFTRAIGCVSIPVRSENSCFRRSVPVSCPASMARCPSGWPAKATVRSCASTRAPDSITSRLLAKGPAGVSMSPAMTSTCSMPAVRSLPSASRNTRSLTNRRATMCGDADSPLDCISIETRTTSSRLALGVCATYTVVPGSRIDPALLPLEDACDRVKCGRIRVV
jgi:hypothetical protein